MMDVRCCTAVFGEADVGMLHKVVLFVHNGLFTPEEHDGVFIIQCAYLIWGHEIPACLLEVLAEGAVAALALAGGAGVNGFFAE